MKSKYPKGFSPHWKPNAPPKPQEKITGSVVICSKSGISNDSVEVPENCCSIYVETIPPSYYKDASVELTFYGPPITIPNPNYEKELVKYEKQYKLYKEKLKEWKTWKKIWDQDQKKIKETSELNEYNTLKKRFETLAKKYGQ